jgi:hypothetical protein
MVLYYRLMTKWSGLDESTDLSWMGLSQQWLASAWAKITAGAAHPPLPRCEEAVASHLSRQAATSSPLLAAGELRRAVVLFRQGLHERDEFVRKG